MAARDTKIAGTSWLQIPQRFVRFILKMNTLRKVLVMGAQLTLKEQFYLFLLGREAHLGKDLGLNPGLVTLHVRRRL